ncbi:MAG: ATP-dependent protease [Alphaproteobacteria bacterium]|nr:ATP-dependent protease [Alphaproteobacteria bacterium]
MPVKPLPPQALKRRSDPAKLGFATTADLKDLDEPLGQERAVEALRFGIGIRSRGFNLFALGPTAIGKHATVRQFVEREAAQQPTPPDWCYVNNFADVHRPKALQLPAGLGAKLQKDMEQLIEELRTAIAAVFESDEYRTRRQSIDEEFREKQGHAFEALQKRANERQVALVRTPVGLALAPMKDNEVMSPDDFQKLPQEMRQGFEATIGELQKELQETIRQIPRWDKERREKVRDVNREVTEFAVGHLIEALRHKYRELADVVAYLNAVQEDVTENVTVFLAQSQAEEGQTLPQGAEASAAAAATPIAAAAPAILRRYQVNLIVDNSATKGAPIVYEDNPAQSNLVGRVEHIQQMGALLTDFALIQPGALHRANGGYLLLDARKLLTHPYAYDALKRALQAGEIRIESPAQMYSMISAVSLEPEPTPLSVKVVLLGERDIYYLLSAYDPEFAELFKVEVDFDEDVDRGPISGNSYSRLIATLVRQHKLRDLDAPAVARVIEFSARLAGHSRKLSIRRGLIGDILHEADYFAAEAERTVICESDVQAAIDARIRRADRVRERSQEQILEGTVLIDLEGERIGQINGLAVLSLGNMSFGRPNRITARVRMGRGEVIDIERQVELGGPIHSKGVLILGAYLSATFAPDRPLSLSASVVFEQSYSGVEGDSASSTELYALLSALAELPLRQSLAVTGSVNQYGQVQAIGGANEKIEGFFDLCRAKGLTGTQGVLIPDSNVKHLMLRDGVIEAVSAGKFHIYPIRTIDEGIEVLTGVPAGKRGRDGRFPDGTVNRKVEDRLIALAHARRAFGAGLPAEGT